MSGLGRYVRMAEGDHVVVALVPLGVGEIVEGICVFEDIPMGHKVAVMACDVGESVIKYGVSIGRATRAIAVGEWVHTHNMGTDLSLASECVYEGGRYRSDEGEEACSGGLPSKSKGSAGARLGSEFSEERDSVDESPDGGSKDFGIFRSGGDDFSERKNFGGYGRRDGRVGIRNQLWIIPMVGCVNGLAERLARGINRELGLPMEREALALTHPFGCSQQGGDHEMTRRILAQLACHPNAGGVLILSLGCENNTLPEFLQEMGDYDFDRVRSLVVQAVGDEYEEGMVLLRSLAEKSAQDQRVECSSDALVVGLKCGGSDAFSGITANPLVGRVADLCAARGGCLVMGEVPEMFGGESILLKRCVNERVFRQGVAMVESYKRYFAGYDCPLGANPSPGNKDGGITTLEEKSLGCVQKGGHVPVTAILEKGEWCRGSGLNLLNGPGNDAVAITLLAATGAQVILFTTGRGTPLGGVVPTLKISSRSALAEQKPHWIDYDAGVMVSRGVSMDQAADDLLGVLDAVVGGQATCNERLDCREIALYKEGVIL